MTEKQLTSSIIEFLNYSGMCKVWRVNSGMLKAEYKGKTRMIRLAKAGTSDILGYKKGTGKFIAIEVKLPTTRKSVTVLQNDFLNEVGMAGGICGVATTEEEALQIVKDEEFNPYLYDNQP